MQETCEEIYLDERDVKEVWVDYRRLWWEHVEGTSVRMIKSMLERFIHEELVRQIGAGWYEHSGGRRGHRSGTRPRRVVMLKGTLEFRIPKVRRGGFVPSVLRRYGQYRDDIEALVREIFLSGVSTRQIGSIVWRLSKSDVSATTVSRMVKALDGEVARFHMRPIEDEYLYVLLDGVSHRVRTSAGCKRRVVLSAML